MDGILDRRTFLLGSTAALAAIGSLAPAAIQRGATPALELEQFGGRAGSGFDNGPALRRALAAAAATRATVALGPGTYEVSAAGLLRDDAIPRPSGVTLAGAGRDQTTLRVTGAGIINQLFTAHDSHGVLTRDMRIVGNGVKSERAPYAGGLISAILRPSARGDLTDIVFQDCDIDNFASATWFHVLNQSPRFRVRQCGSRGCNWTSRPGTCPQPGNLGVPGHFIYFDGASGPIEDVLIDDLDMDARHIKGGVALVGNVDGGSVHVRRLRDAGQAIASASTGPNGAGAYAILLYQNPNAAPRNLRVTVDQLENPYSAGIYAVGALASQFVIGHAFGQRDERDATIYKGILVLSSCRGIDARLGLVEDSNRVVMISMSSEQNLGAAQLNIDLGEVRSRRGARDITIAATGAPWAGGVRISGRRSGPAAIGVQLRGSDRFGLQDIDLGGLSSTGAQASVVTHGLQQAMLRRVRLPD